ncbi:MAG TPA: metal-dependent hydrolase [Candidatus Saccharimonadales bacterium]|nr:metal-dependent hydrolase [Candidatus Saccharimonadales bacterium]
MPGYKGHIVGATAAGALYVGALSVTPGTTERHTAGLLSEWQLLVGLFVVAILFGLWPDVDTNSKGQNIFFGLAFVADILLILSGRLEAAAYFGLLAMTPILGKHRGWTHSKLAMILVPLPIAVIPYLYRPSVLTPALLLYGAAVAGYFSHLLLDGLIFKHIRVKGR